MVKDYPWYKKAVVYQIYPRSFQDSNNDGVGDLPGIISRLGYLQDLGITAIWLSPIYKSPMADFGYDISDHCDVDPIFGTLADFDRLVKEAHNRGIKIIMDFVPNHTSVQHPWFLESRSSRENPKRDWYIWHEPDPKNSLPNNWLSHFGGSAWELDLKSGQYYLHSFLKDQPDLNWRNPQVVEAMHNVLRFWLNRGVDGFRTDAVDFLVKDQKFRNDPANPSFLPGKDDPYHSLLHKHSRKQPEVFSFLNGFCQVLEEYQDRFMVNEVYADIPEMEKYYRACKNGLLAPFNFNLMALPWAATDYKKFINDYESCLRPNDLSNYVIANHDHSRIATKYGQNGARLAAMLTLTLRGLIVLYYGDELGMEDVAVPHDSALDPWEKNEPGFKLGRDPERSPMQWDSSAYAGFSSVTPWLPVAENYQHINVEAESADTRSMLSLYRFLVNFRLNNPALLFGVYASLNTNNDHIFAYTRETGGKKFLVVLNFSETGQKVSLKSINAKIICTTYLDRPRGENISLHNFALRPNEGYLLEI